MTKYALLIVKVDCYKFEKVSGELQLRKPLLLRKPPPCCGQIFNKGGAFLVT